MKCTLILFSFLLCIQSLAAQDVSALLKDAESFEALPNELAALSKYVEVLQINPKQIHALSKCSELCSRIGKREKDKASRDTYYQAARTYAQTAISIDPTNAEANCSMAIALGRTTMSRSGKEKLATSKEIRKHVDLSIRTDPKNFLAWHVLGRWHYEIASLNMVERAAVKIFYGGLPSASFKESIAAFERSEELTPGFILNYYELARAYHKDGQNDRAISILKKMMNLPNHTEDDDDIKMDGRKLLLILQKFH
jgi:tetratricopeptide (TPR) repeat protein